MYFLHSIYRFSQIFHFNSQAFKGILKRFSVSLVYSSVPVKLWTAISKFGNEGAVNSMSLRRALFK